MMHAELPARSQPAPRRAIDLPAPGTTLPMVTLRDVLRTLSRRRWPMLAILIAAVLGSVAYVTLTSTTYTASTRVLVRVGRDKLAPVILPDSAVSSFVFAEKPENVNDAIEILRGEALLQRVIPVLRERLDEIAAAAPRPPWWRQLINDARDLAKEAARLAMVPIRAVLGSRQLTPEQALAEKFRRAIAAATVKETNVFIAGFTWDDPDFAAFAMNTLLDAFVQEHIRVMSGAEQQLEFYRGQVQRAEAELHGIAEALVRQGRDAGMTDPPAEKTLLLSLITGLERDLALARVAEDQARRRAAEVLAAAEGADWPATPAVPQVQLNQLADLDLRHGELTTRRSALLVQLRPAAREVRELDSQIAQLRRQKIEALAAYFDDRIRTEQDQLRGITERLTEARARLDAATALESRFLELQGRRDQLLLRAREYRRELERLTLVSRLDGEGSASLRVLTRATPPLLPTWPRRSLIVGLAAALGLLLAIAYAVFAEFFDRTVSTERDAERVLGLPVLGRLPELPAR